MPYRQHKKVREEISRAFLQYTFVMGRNVTTVAQLHKFSGAKWGMVPDDLHKAVFAVT